MCIRDRDSGTGMSMPTVVQEINTEYDTKLQDEKNSVSYYVLEMNGSRAVWKEVLAVYSVKEMCIRDRALLPHSRPLCRRK